MSQIMRYFLHSTSVLLFHIDAIVTFSMQLTDRLYILVVSYSLIPVDVLYLYGIWT